MRLDDLQRDLAAELSCDLEEIIDDWLKKGRPLHQARAYVADYGSVFGQVCRREGMREDVVLRVAMIAYRAARIRWIRAGKSVDTFDAIVGPVPQIAPIVVPRLVKPKALAPIVVPRRREFPA